MGKFNNYIKDHRLFKVGNLNTATIVTKIIAGMLISKAIAVFIGVEGMALVGNLRNFLSAIHTFSILGFYNGLVQSISEYKHNALKLSQTLSTAYYFGFVATILVAFFCYYNADGVNDLLFSSNYNYTYVIKILAVALPFYTLNMFSFSIMNGFSKYKMLLIINIIGQFLGLSVTLILIYQNNIDGALVAAVVAPSLILLITVVGFINQRSLVSSVKISNVNVGVLKKFAPFAMIALVTTIAIPMVSIGIRNYIIDEVGIKQAGYWEAMQRISDYYLMFINSLITLYFLPRFAHIDGKKEFSKEIISLYKTIIPVFGLGLIVIYLLRSFLISLIFSDAFQPTEELFLWQLMGDFIKVLSIVIAYQFIAKKMFAHFIIIEVFLVVVMYLSSVYLIDKFGVKGAVMGHFVSYLMHYGIILLIFGGSIFKVIPEGLDNK